MPPKVRVDPQVQRLLGALQTLDAMATDRNRGFRGRELHHPRCGLKAGLSTLIRDYGTHRSDCATRNKAARGPCDCGYDVLVRAFVR